MNADAQLKTPLSFRQVRDFADFLYGHRGPYRHAPCRSEEEEMFPGTVLHAYRLKFYPDRELQRVSLGELSVLCTNEGLPAPTDLVAEVDSIGLAITLIWVVGP